MSICIYACILYVYMYICMFLRTLIYIHNLATKNSRCPSFAATQNMILNQAALMHMHSGFGSKLKMICDTPLTMAQAAMAPTTMPRCTLPPTPSHEEATTRSISTSDVESAGEGAKLEEAPLEKKSTETDRQWQ